MFCRSLFVFLYFFFWPLYCLSFYDIRILITPLVSSNSSYPNHFFLIYIWRNCYQSFSFFFFFAHYLHMLEVSNQRKLLWRNIYKNNMQSSHYFEIRGRSDFSFMCWQKRSQRQQGEVVRVQGEVKIFL
jgi:hypothetical protein